MRKKYSKMGKRSGKSNAVRKSVTNGKNSSPYVRDSFPDESNDSGLGSDTHLSLPDSNSSSCVEESDSLDSVDSGISKHTKLATCKQPRTNQSLCPAASSGIQVASSLAFSLNTKMHIRHTQNEINSPSCFDEPPTKCRRVTPNVEIFPGNSSIDLFHRLPLTQSSLLLNPPVSTEAFNSGNSAAKRSLSNDFENRDWTDSKDGIESSAKDGYTQKGAPDQNLRNGESFATLRSEKPPNWPSLHVAYPSRSRNGKIELCIVVQPEEQHRARYMTEGSRGSIKDDKGTGFPTIKLIGYNKSIQLFIFIGSDQGKVLPHLFYQACKVTGKNCTPCTEDEVNKTNVIGIEMTPENDMTVSCDCIGILKERNVDVEKKLPFFGLTRCKKRSTKCRMVFRVLIPLPNGTYEVLQVSSSQILCTQSPGLPEICKKSLTESSMAGGSELFIIGKNFQKDAKIVFQQLTDDQSELCSGKDSVVWEEIVDPEKEYTHQSHLVCCVPPYRNPDVPHSVKVFLSVLSGGKSSEPHTFTYTPLHAVQKETFVHSAMQQTGISSVPLDISHHFTKNGMDSRNQNLSPDMLSATANGDSALRSMLSPAAHLNEGCSSPGQLSPHSIPLRSPSSSVTLSPLSTNRQDSTNMLNQFNPTVPVNMTLMSNDCGSMLLSDASGVHTSGHMSSLERLPSTSSNASLAGPSLPSSPIHTITTDLQLMAHTPSKHGIIGLTMANDEHHEVDLMSGINQLATEMVRAQEDANADAISSRVVQIAANMVSGSTDLNPGTGGPSLATSFVKDCLNLMDVPMAPMTLVSHELSPTMTSMCSDPAMATIGSTYQSVPSQDMVHRGNTTMVGHSSPLLAKMEPLSPMDGLHQGIIVTTSGSPSTLNSSTEVFETMASVSMPMCQASHSLRPGESNCQLTVANMHQADDSSLDVKPSLPPTTHLEGAANVQQMQTMDAPFSSNSAPSVTHPADNLPPTTTCNLSNLIETKVDPMVYTTACSSNVLYDASAGSQGNALPPNQVPALNRATSHSDITGFGINMGSAATVCAENRLPENALEISPSSIKTEKPDRTADLSCFQQTMTMALSQLSEADLLSIINPCAFDSV